MSFPKCAVEHSDECFGRLLQTVDNVIPVANAAVGDAGSDLVQELVVILPGQYGVDEAAQRQALRQDLAHRGRKPIGAVAGADPLYCAIRPLTGTRA